MLTRMVVKSDGLYISKKKNYQAVANLKSKTVATTLKFAYDMTFGNNGEHRNHRTGGTHLRKKGEIFANTFQGKLSEFALYNMLYKDFQDLPTPDLDTYGLGEWDDTDFELNGKKYQLNQLRALGTYYCWKLKIGTVKVNINLIF